MIDGQLCRTVFDGIAGVFHIPSDAADGITACDGDHHNRRNSQA